MNAIKDNLTSKSPAVAFMDAVKTAGGIVGAREPGELPRSKRQVYDLNRNMKKTDQVDELLQYLKHGEEAIVIEHHDVPEDLWVLGKSRMTNDLSRFCTSELVISHVELARLMNLAMDGHNVFVGGKPGTGKTYIVKQVVSVLQQTKHVKVTCTTGMACSLYDDAMTLHSFGGIQNSRMNVDSIVSSIMSRDTCKRRWLETDVLCIDEVSQLSAKNVELMNTLAQRVRGSTKLLGHYK